MAIHGGATTVNQYLAAGLIDEMRLHVVPMTLGAGIRLFDGVPPLDLQQIESRTASAVTHLTYRGAVLIRRTAREAKVVARDDSDGGTWSVLAWQP